jgi:hypothetical protein
VGGRILFVPEVLGGGVGGFDEGDNPAVKATAFVGDKSDGGTAGGKEEDKRPFDVKREGESIGDEGENDTTGEPAELLEGHITDEAKLVRGDLGGDGVLF